MWVLEILVQWNEIWVGFSWRCYVASAKICYSNHWFFVGNLFKLSTQDFFTWKAVVSFLREVRHNLYAIRDSFYQTKIPKQILDKRKKLNITKIGNPFPFVMHISLSLFLSLSLFIFSLDELYYFSLFWLYTFKIKTLFLWGLSFYFLRSIENIIKA